MKESKINQNLENNDIEDFADKKFEEDLAEIKQKLNAEKLSDEFKEKLQARLEEQLNADNSKEESKIIKFPVITRKLAGICACFILLFTSCFAFADEIEGVFLKFFSNTDKIVEKAIANGNYKEIDMDYVEDNGVSIKVDYIITEEDCLYIAFNVKNEEEFDRVLISEIDIFDKDKYLIYSKGNMGYLATFSAEKQFINKNNAFTVYKLLDLKKSPKEIEELTIFIKKIHFYKSENNINKNGNWEIKVNI